MIISRTPLRISFFGGGTDLPSFYEKEFGCVISSTINKHVHLVVHNAFDNNYKIHYNKTEIVSKIEDIENTRVKSILKKSGIKNGVEIYSIGEVPKGTGLGSSSSFSVGLLNAINCLKENNLSKEDLARFACETEIEDLKEPIGKQDQYAAAYGGFNYIQFNPDGSTKISPMNLDENLIKKIQERIIIFYLNKTRDASKILREQNSEIISNSEKFNSLKKLKELTLKMKEELEEGKIENFGKRLHEGWMIKRSLTNSISNSFIDEIYEKGLSSGATGGKVLGAGGGGFILFYCEPENQEKLRKTLSSLKELKTIFEKEGSQIAYEY